MTQADTGPAGGGVDRPIGDGNEYFFIGDDEGAIRMRSSGGCIWA
jgi:hypothetical protein